ncbi:MAG: endonuclease/exonuclease/phosphatase family protein [bacterium]|nr:endonuclease/exonuclease/phosphatase family protein [bacterium]
MTFYTIVTFNTNGIFSYSPVFYEKSTKMSQYSNTENIDIINLQEVFFYHHLYYLKKKLIKFPYCIFVPSLIGPKGGLVTFSRFPLQLVSYKLFKKRGYIFDLSCIDIFLRKGMLFTKFSQTNLYVLNTHFSANFGNDWKTDNKYISVLKSQIDQLHRLLAAFSPEDTCIIAGDFNIPKKSSLYTILKSNILMDVFGAIDKPTYIGNLMYHKNENLQIDYIFFYGKKQWNVVDKKQIFTEKVLLKNNKKAYLSDHIGLQATFHLLLLKKRQEVFVI